MPGQAPAPNARPASDGLDFYRTRDDMARAYQPVSEEEHLLVTQIAHAWIALKQANQLRSDITARYGLMNLFDSDLERYKILQRTVSDAERIWRNAVQEFWRARRRRESGSLSSPRRRSVANIDRSEPVQPAIEHPSLSALSTAAPRTIDPLPPESTVETPGPDPRKPAITRRR